MLNDCFDELLKVWGGVHDSIFVYIVLEVVGVEGEDCRVLVRRDGGWAWEAGMGRRGMGRKEVVTWDGNISLLLLEGQGVTKDIMGKGQLMREFYMS